VRRHQKNAAANGDRGLAKSRQSWFSNDRSRRYESHPQEKQCEDPALTVDLVARTKGKTPCQTDPDCQRAVGYIISRERFQGRRRKGDYHRESEAMDHTQRR
jgi:hypothetical protein